MRLLLLVFTFSSCPVGNGAYSVMSTLKISSASETLKEQTKKETLFRESLSLPAGINLTIVGTDIVRVTNSDAGHPIIILQKGDDAKNTIKVFLRGLIKDRYNFRGEIVPIKGALNTWVRDRAHKNIGDILADIDKNLVGKEVVTTLSVYSRQGDFGIYDAKINGYDLVEE